MSLHLQCRTQDEIAKAVGVSQVRVNEVLSEIADLQKAIKPLGPKDAVTHGQWLPWLKKEFEFDQKTAWNWMQCYKRSDKLGTIPNLTPADAYKRKDKYETISHLTPTDDYKRMATCTASESFNAPLSSKLAVAGEDGGGHERQVGKFADLITQPGEYHGKPKRKPGAGDKLKSQ